MATVTLLRSRKPAPSPDPANDATRRRSRSSHDSLLLEGGTPVGMHLPPKLFTPINIGCIGLGHRIIVDWERRPAAKPADGSPPASVLGGGLAVHEFEVFVPNTVPSDGARSLGGVARSRAAAIARSIKAGQMPIARLRSLAPPWFRNNPNWVTLAIDAYCQVAIDAQRAGVLGIEIDATPGTLGEWLVFSDGARSLGCLGLSNWQPDGLMALLEGVRRIVGHQQVGVRMAPFASEDLHVRETCVDALRTLHENEVAFVRLELESWFKDGSDIFSPSAGAAELRRAYSGLLLVAGVQSVTQAIGMIASRWADGVCINAGAPSSSLLEEFRNAADRHCRNG